MTDLDGADMSDYLLSLMATSAHLRKVNQRKIVHSMVKVRSASRTKLAAIAGMSQATVGRIVEELITQSVLSEVDDGGGTSKTCPPQLGRPSRLLELDRARRRFLLVQLGVRQTRLAAVPVAIPDVDQWTVQFETPDTKGKWFSKLGRACGELPIKGIEAIIFSCPGVVDESAGRVLLCPNIHWAEQCDFSSGFESIVRSPVIFLQEIRALALGQMALAPSLGDFLLVDAGDGLGGASVIGGQLQIGHLPLCGELGHTPVLGNDRRCGCGSIGCVETLVSRRGLLQSFRENGGPRSWKSMLAHFETEEMPKWLKVALDALAVTVAGAINVEGIAHVVLTGILTEFPAEIIQYLGEQIRRGAMWSRLGTVNFHVAPRHRTAGMISAGIDRALFPTGAGAEQRLLRRGSETV